MMNVTVSDWLAKRAALSPERVGLEVRGTRYTFAQIHQATDEVASLLFDREVREGCHIALLLPNGPHHVFTVHAVARLGAVCVPLNLRLTPHELAQQIEDADITLLVYHSTLSDLAARLHAGTGVPSLCIDTAEKSTTPVPTTRFPMETVHTIVYTSGTTGRPKGAMLTYGSHFWSAVGSVLNLGLHADDKWLACVPLFHVSGLSILMRSVIYGIPVLLHERFDPDDVNEAIEGQGVTIISVVSSMLARMLDARGDAPYPGTLRCVLVGGGPVPKSLLERCRALGVPVVQTYGLSETASQVVTLAPRDAFRKLGSAGRPLFPVELRILAGSHEAGPNEAGEILLRGPNVMAGYYKRPDETALALRDGWLYTGDIGYLDEEGYLYVLDRRSDLIISGGENVYPAEVEAVLVAHPAVAEAAVVGKEHAEWGAVPVAFVCLRPGYAVEADDLVRFCRERLAGYKVPKEVHFAAELPRNAGGKLVRAELRERLGRDG